MGFAREKEICLDEIEQKIDILPFGGVEEITEEEMELILRNDQEDEVGKGIFITGILSYGC